MGHIEALIAAPAPWTVALLERARAVHRCSMTDCLAQRSDLAAGAEELAGLFREPTSRSSSTRPESSCYSS
ncbi:hypothetical protein ACH4S8_04090 [Streptomyces sp. NPDC021080]|uniref:hypothetical protein n=1 Tax=Streptomyces sp. NPDC021080 TaxID=3365110 RepID=UPI0037A16DAF